MRRVWIALTAVAVALVMAVPVGAAVDCEDPKSASNPTCSDAGDVIAYEVTMGFVEGRDGFSTSTGCTDGGSMRMEETDGGYLGALFPVSDPGPLLGVNISTVDWYRYYPYYADPSNLPDGFDPNDYPLASPLTGTALTVCHGAGIDVTIKWDGDVKVLDEDRPIARYDGLMRIIPHDGSIEFLWHSDYYREWENVGKKKPRYIGNDMEDFTYSGGLAWRDKGGNPVIWDPINGASGMVSGNVRISHFSPGAYVPFEDGGEDGFPVEFVLSVIPIDG